MNPRCPTHGTPLRHTPTKYGKRYACAVQGCTVACWSGKTSTPADAETRALRLRCHEVFDALWRNGARSPFCGEPGGKSARRQRAYAWLSRVMGKPPRLTHFGMFTADECRAALEAIATLEVKA